MRFIRRRWWLLLLPALALGWWLHARQGAGADIVFLSYRDGSLELRRMHGDGTGVRRLITESSTMFYLGVGVSPDGKHLAYMQFDDAKDEAQIWVADIYGANPRQLARGRRSQLGPALFLDGQTLVYCASLKDGSHLYRIDLDGTDVRQFIPGTYQVQRLAVSPDGRCIVIASDRSGNNVNCEIYRINADGSGLTQLTTHPGDDRDLAISPDGRRIVFSSDRGGTRDLYLIDIHGRHPRRLTHETGDAIQPVFSPDGKRIAYTVLGDGHAYADICVINVDGSGRKALTNNWFRYAVYQRLGDNTVSRFLGVTKGHGDHSPAWVPAE